MPTAEAQALIAQARKVRDDSLAAITPPLTNIPEALPKNVTKIADDVLTEEELKITNYDAPELIDLIKRKELTSEAVTRAFLRRAALAQKLVWLNCHHRSHILMGK